MSENQVAREVAEAEFSRFVETMDIDVDKSKLDIDDAAKLDQLRETFVSAVEKGRLVVDEHGQPIYTTKDGKSFTFREPTGATILKMQKESTGGASANQIAFSMMTETNQLEYAKMLRRDHKVIDAVLVLFFG
jgi:hypothetical protein